MTLNFRNSKIGDRWLRNRLKRKKHLNWWLVHGSTRTGTTYMIDIIATCSRLWISDWGLEDILKRGPEYDYIRFDYVRALKDISHNILDNAYQGGDSQLDLAVKEADIVPEEYKMLVQMWGKPNRTIFCYRQPAAYISSADKHFRGPFDIPLVELQRRYVHSFDVQKQIGGDPFEYHPGLVLDDYCRFLQPLYVNKEITVPFVHKGEDKPEFTTDEMWLAYREFRKTHKGA